MCIAASYLVCTGAAARTGHAGTAAHVIPDGDQDFHELAALDVWMCGVAFCEIWALKDLDRVKWPTCDNEGKKCTSDYAVLELSSFLKIMMKDAEKRLPLCKPGGNCAKLDTHWCVSPALSQ